MSDIVYLRLAGKKQGAISSGCGSSESMGNRWQIGHEDEIFAFALSNSMARTINHANIQELIFCKPTDKSSPLLCNAITNNEQLFLEFYFYRISRYGRWEKYYYIQLRGASLSSIQSYFSSGESHIEIITIKYDYILCKHLIANTEFSYLALPANYSSLFIPDKPRKVEKKTNTLNSKAVGRLLAAGGLYNGNVEGFRKTAEQLGGEVQVGYDQVMNDRTKGSLIALASIAASFGMNRTGLTSELDEFAQFNRSTSLRPTSAIN